MTTMTTTTTTPPRSWFTRWVAAPCRAFWRAQAEMAAAGAGYPLVYNRFPQPRPQTDAAEAEHAYPASAGKVLAGV